MQDNVNSELPAPKRTPWNKGKLTGANGRAGSICLCCLRNGGRPVVDGRQSIKRSPLEDDGVSLRDEYTVLEL